MLTPCTLPSVGPPSALGHFVGAIRQHGVLHRTASASSGDNDEVTVLAAVQLITVALSEMGRDPKVGRAEALRRSMAGPHRQRRDGRGPSSLFGSVRGGW